MYCLKSATQYAMYYILTKHFYVISNMLCCQEYELHIEEGNLLYAGVDYEMILREAEKEADIVLWDGGNNDFCFFQPTVTICVADALREGHEEKYYPGEINMRCVKESAGRLFCNGG